MAKRGKTGSGGSFGPIDDPRRLRDLRRKLLAWFATHKRDLPWRRSGDPYRVWISEIMLQQTQVATVVPYYERFLQAFPDVRALAAAPEEAVLRLWEGLGYYRRARQLHRAAQVIVERHAGDFPRELADVRELPGIGRYTAGAITSIAYDTPAPILEANTVRLFSRLTAFEGVTANSEGQAYLWSVAERVTPRRGAGELNQALMELGSLICTPREPDCPRCPIATHCAARLAGRQRELPRAAAKIAFTAVQEAAVVIWRGGRVFLRQRQAGERWAGLWDFPRFELKEGKASTERCEDEDPVRGEVVILTRQLTGLKVDGVRQLTTIKHGVTRYRITLNCFEADFRSGKVFADLQAHCRWVDPTDLTELPLSTTGRKISRLLLKHQPLLGGIKL
jgi:A/G-specific adenine glycosylase